MEINGLYIGGAIAFVAQVMVNIPGMFDQARLLRKEKQVDNISLFKWMWIWIALAAFCFHTWFEKPNMYVFGPTVPGLFFTTVIVGQIVYYRYFRRVAV